MIVAEILDAEGQALSRVKLQGACVVGTDRACGLVLADPTVEPRHVELSEGPAGTVVLRRLADGGETRVGSLMLGSEAEVTLPATVSVGAVSLRLTDGVPGAAVAPRAAGWASSGAATAWALCVGAALLITAQDFLGIYKTHPWHQALSMALGVLVLVPIWAGLWTIGNRLFSYRGRFHGHLVAVSGWALVAVPVGWVLTGSVEVLHTDAMGVVEVGVNLFLFAWLLYRHIRVASRWRPRTNAVIAGAVVVAIASLGFLAIDTDAEKPVKGALSGLSPLPAALYMTRPSDGLTTQADKIFKSLDGMEAKRSVKQGP